MIRTALAVALVLVFAACTGVRLLPAVPKAEYATAEVVGFEAIRVWGDEAPANAAALIADIRDQISARIADEGTTPNRGQFDILILSGGGADGAFGAGFMNGWSDRGTRPEFSIVTGISTGAMIAPYAFLGRDYDDELERFFTNVSTDDVLSLGILNALTGRTLGLTDTGGFFLTLDAAVTDQLVAEIAAEHRKGRRLWIGTTNLDAQRPVIWDIGAIAATGRPEARPLIRDVLIASASIPGAFEPQQITVEAGDARYSEMHVDGGVTRQLFLFPREVVLSDYAPSTRGPLDRGTIYAIRNTKLHPVYAETGASIVDIASRSMSTLIKYAGVADVAVLEEQARRDGFGLLVTSVPEDFDQVEDEPFDKAYMRALYDLGYRLAREGEPWIVAVPPPE